jgi:hypothetical protein
VKLEMNQPNEIDPFAPPMTSTDAPPRGGRDGAWNQLGGLVTSTEAVLPDRCVKCNRPTEGHHLKRTMYWHSPWLYLLCISIWIYLIVALIVRKKAIVTFGLCPEHQAARRKGIWMAWGIVAATVVAIVALNDAGWGLVAFLAGLVGLVVAVRLRVAVLRPTRIDGTHAYIAGAGEAFVASLPPLR